MNLKMKQKGIIQIPFLIAIIVVVVMGSVIGAGVILQTQGKLDPLLANVSQVFQGTEEPLTIETEEVKPKEPIVKEPQAEQESEEISQQELESELEQTRLETERAKAEAERLRAEQEAKRIAEEQRRQEESRRRQEEVLNSKETEEVKRFMYNEIVKMKQEINQDYYLPMCDNLSSCNEDICPLLKDMLNSGIREFIDAANNLIKNVCYSLEDAEDELSQKLTSLELAVSVYSGSEADEIKLVGVLKAFIELEQELYDKTKRNMERQIREFANFWGIYYKP